MIRNRFAGEPFDDDEVAIAAALRDVSVPALLCSLVHLTGDPKWVRGDIRPRLAMASDVQSGIPVEEQDIVRRAALAEIVRYGNEGCHPHELSRELLLEMMHFIGCRTVTDRQAGLFFDDLQFDGIDPAAVTWGDELPESVKASAPTVVIGCGLGGILAGIRLQQAGLPFVIVEKNAGPGGTWWENSYPGARVDIGSHQYCYAFEPGDHWSEFYCQQPELRDYFESMVEKYGLLASCRFETKVERIEWDESGSAWKVHVRTNGGASEILDARFVISAVGSLNLPKLPSIPGMADFAGESFHSARWPGDLDLEGKRLALVGAGASGFQIAPTIAPRVEHLDIFQRTAQWIIPNPIYHAPVPDGDRWALRHLPFYGRWYRLMFTVAGITMGTEPYRIDPDYEDPTSRSVNQANAKRADILLEWMTSLIADRPDLAPKVIPDYPAIGKRVLQDNGSWLRCLQLPNVELNRTAIERIAPDGVVTADGVHHPADIICYATGFRHNDFLASMDVIGRGGASLRDQWGEEPMAYLGITIPNFPNLFAVYGPGTNLAAGASLFYHSEFQIHYAMEAIRETLSREARVCEVRQDVHDSYSKRYQDEIGQMVWSHPSIRNSHYKNPEGKVFTLSPWPLDLYWQWTRRVDPEEYSFS